jgi:hypothetical protein
MIKFWSGINCILVNWPKKITLNRLENNWKKIIQFGKKSWINMPFHGLRTPREEIAFTLQPKIQSQSQIFRYGGSKVCLPNRPNFSDIFDLCLHWVTVVRVPFHNIVYSPSTALAPAIEGRCTSESNGEGWKALPRNLLC